jgi:hypothetical protein
MFGSLAQFDTITLDGSLVYGETILSLGSLNGLGALPYGDSIPVFRHTLTSRLTHS